MSASRSNMSMMRVARCLLLTGLLISVALAGCTTPDPEPTAPTGLTGREVPLEGSPDRLPSEGAALVWTGEALFLFGGERPNRTAIHRYDPETGELTRLDVELPGPRRGGVAVWTGEAIYVLGGIEGRERHIDFSLPDAADGIVRFDPSDGSVRHLDVDVPLHRDSTVAWGGDGIYILGANADASARAIHRWRPGSDRFERLETELPFTVRQAEAIWTGDRVLIFGGKGSFPDGSGSRFHTTVLGFDPTDASVEVRSRDLPWSSASTTRIEAVWTGETALAFPGDAFQGWAGTGPVIRYDPSTGNWTERSDGLPGLRHPGIVFASEDGVRVVVDEARCDGHAGEVLRYPLGPRNVSRSGPQPTASFDGTVSSSTRISPDACASRAPEGIIVAYRWSFGDGTNGTGVDPHHVYDRSGTYNVTLTVVDDQGRTNRTTQQVTVGVDA